MPQRTNKIITIAAWKRPNYFRQVIKSLEQADKVDEYSIWVSVDGGHPDKQKMMNNIAKNSKLNIEMFLQKQNFGCAKNTWKILETGFKYSEQDYIIHLEDDIVVAKDFITFMEAALLHYKDNPRVFSVGASSENKKVHTDPEVAKHVNRKQFFSCWGWGTWRRIWDEVSPGWFGIHWNSKRDNTKQPPQGEEFLKVIRKSDKGSWAWPMNSYWRKDRWEVRPGIGRIFNIGRDNTTFGNANVWDSKHSTKKWMGNLELPIPDEYNFPEVK